MDTGMYQKELLFRTLRIFIPSEPKFWSANKGPRKYRGNYLVYVLLTRKSSFLVKIVDEIQ